MKLLNVLSNESHNFPGEFLTRMSKHQNVMPSRVITQSDRDTIWSKNHPNRPDFVLRTGPAISSVGFLSKNVIYARSVVYLEREKCLKFRPYWAVPL